MCKIMNNKLRKKKSKLIKEYAQIINKKNEVAVERNTYDNRLERGREIRRRR